MMQSRFFTKNSLKQQIFSLKLSSTKYFLGVRFIGLLLFYNKLIKGKERIKMHVLGYVLIWSSVLGLGMICEQRKENRRLKKQLEETHAPEEIKRNFRSMTA